jgi:hypothetical protein
MAENNCRVPLCHLDSDVLDQQNLCRSEFFSKTDRTDNQENLERVYMDVLSHIEETTGWFTKLWRVFKKNVRRKIQRTLAYILLLLGKDWLLKKLCIAHGHIWALSFKCLFLSWHYFALRSWLGPAPPCLLLGFGDLLPSSEVQLHYSKSRSMYRTPSLITDTTLHDMV